ncbi:MAG: MmcQ/YjbR family DNA-binding protein [Clostridia bacterium]|nr:MmcQ/YjbR family DNA-binding protein [Clostridia bacterium]
MLTDRVKMILDYAKRHFDTEPEYLWKTAPNYAVLRNKVNKKWYGIIMDVPKENLGVSGGGILWIINVKCDPMMIGSFVNRRGFLRAYHMNKEHWMSIVIDDEAVEIDEIFRLLDMSYEIVRKSKK